MKKITFLFLLILLSTKINAQSKGGLDLTFNPADNGYSGVNFAGSDPNQPGRQSIILQQPDGKLIIEKHDANLTKTFIARINADGSLDNSFNTTDNSFNTTGSGVNRNINSILLQSDGKIVIGGDFTTYNGIATNGLVRINSDGTLDTSFYSLGTQNSVGVSSISLQSDGKIICSFLKFENNVFSYNIVRINTDGSLDSSFNSGTGINSSIYLMALQPDGKIIIGGDFTTYNGITANRLARINIDGSLDSSFNFGTGANSYIYSMALQPDGKIIIGGSFTTYNGITANRLARINIDGSLDSSFNSGTGANYSIYSMALQPDGKMVIGGDFTTYNGITANKLARINIDGTFDNSFNTNGTGVEGSAWSTDIATIFIQSDGKIIIAGFFFSYNDVPRNLFARLNVNGSLDMDFNSSVVLSANGAIATVALQTDGKILIGGEFTAYYGISRKGIARINTNGSLDRSFNPVLKSGARSEKIIIQPDGKILVAYVLPLDYNTFVQPSGITRLNSDGSQDTTFNSNIVFSSYDGIFSMVLQSDGKIIVGGAEHSNNKESNTVIRLNSDGSLDSTFNYFNYTIGDNRIYINKVLIQQNGKIIIKRNIGGSINDDSDIIRLNTDGTLDTTFNTGSGTDRNITSMNIQSDGKIVLGGSFGMYNNIPVTGGIVRLNEDGSIDSSLNSNLKCGNCVSSDGSSVSIHSIILLPNGEMLVNGGFSANKGLVVLNSDGSIDNTSGIRQLKGYIDSGVLQPDGKLVIGGSFYMYDKTLRTEIARIDLFNLSSNFKLVVTNPSCQSKKNGKLTITTATKFDYIATMNKTDYPFNNTLTIDSLPPNTYTICTKIPALNNYTQCFEFVVNELSSLTGTTTLQTNGNNTIANIIIKSGTAPYNVEINGKTIKVTSEKTITIPIQNGDLLEVKSSNSCEGIISQKIDLYQGTILYPNPATDYAKLFIPSKIQRSQIKIQMIDNFGKVIINKEFKVSNQQIIIPMEYLPAGLYFIKLQLEKPLTFKVIKK